MPATRSANGSDGHVESEESETTTINTKVPQFNGTKGDKYMLWKMKFEADQEMKGLLYGRRSFPISKKNFQKVR